MWAIIDPVSRVCIAVRRDIPEDEEVGFNLIVGVDNAPNADEIAVIDRGEFRGWRVCADRQAANAAHRIIAKFADPLQAHIYSLKEGEARFALSIDKKNNKPNWVDCCPILHTEADETNVDFFELARRVVRRANDDRSAFSRAVAMKEAVRRRDKVGG